VPDPAEARGNDAQRAQAYWDAATTLRRRIELMMALPIASLDRLALQREVGVIGRV
jgi:arsenate reductase